MSSDTIINITNLNKKFNIYNAPHHRLLQSFFGSKKKYYNEFWALKNISYKIKRGECIGIIGQNGSGKSVLLQIITGTMKPTIGEVSVKGRISALLELGTGFNPEFTGRENIYLNGAILGISKEDMDKKFDDIASFADIGEFIEQPVKHYSSGMYVRLGFAIAINVEPEILIIDEALSVGDVRFQNKCFRKLKEFRDSRKTILFVSHDTTALKLLCDRAFWLEKGEIKMQGEPVQITKEYISFMTYGLNTIQNNIIEENKKYDIKKSNVKIHDIKWISTENCESFGAGGASILATALYKKSSKEPVNLFEGGEDVIYFVKIYIKQRIVLPIIGFILNDIYGLHLIGYNNGNLGIDFKPLKPGETAIFRFEFSFPIIKDGTYHFSTAIAEGAQSTHINHHWIHDAYTIETYRKSEITKIGPYFIPEKLTVMKL